MWSFCGRAYVVYICMHYDVHMKRDAMDYDDCASYGCPSMVDQSGAFPDQCSMYDENAEMSSYDFDDSNLQAADGQPFEEVQTCCHRVAALCGILTACCICAIPCIESICFYPVAYFAARKVRQYIQS